MGIPKFFRYISERYPCLTEKLKDYQIPEFDNLYLDVNGIIHGCSHPDDADVLFRITEETIFKNIFHYLELLFRMIQPQKLFFIGIDGVAPRAKINQQRGRRFRSAKEAQVQEAKAKAAGLLLPTEKRFDSNCITPGTLFMSKLDEQLKYFITYKISTDKLWQKCKVVFSGSQVPGEGEHKIMDYIRYIKAQPDYDINTKHCLYGLDADLIMLGLCTHEIHFTLLREEVIFGKKHKKASVTPEETKFCLFHLSLLRDYIDHEFSSLKDKLSFPYDLERIIDDWVLMGFLVGNDFIPHLPNLHIARSALSVLSHVYMDVLPTLDGYINESGTLKLDRFEKFMERLSLFDMIQFSDHYADLKYFESKTGRPLTVASDKVNRIKSEGSEETMSPKRLPDKEFEALLRSAAEMSIARDEDEEGDNESDSDTYTMEFAQRKKDYYIKKLEYQNVDEAFLRSQAEGYVRAIQWNLHYYYNGCCSWTWYYPHHYAPYISDIKDFKDLKLEFELGEPFLPLEQLLAALPPYSKDLLPSAFQHLLTEEQSPIIHYYPAEFQTDLNGKEQEWEAVVLIPFINEKKLLDAMAPHYVKLSAEEMARNKYGPMSSYSYTDENLGIYTAPEYFPDIISYAKVQLMSREDIVIPQERLVRGLSPGVKLDVYYPGFSTLQYIDHTASLEKAKVKVFQRQSHGESMVLHVKSLPKTNLATIVSKLLGRAAYVNWPHLREALVVGVSNCNTKLNLTNSKTRNFPETVNEEAWNLQTKQIIETFKSTMGVDVGDTKFLIHARLLVGTKYVYGSHGKLHAEKQWSDKQTCYPYQTVVKDITVHSNNVEHYKTVADIFVPGTICFMLGHPYYGSVGRVREPGVCKKSGRIKVSVVTTREPSFESIKQVQSDIQTQYMPGSVAAQRLGISSLLLSRITGKLYVKQFSGESQQDETTQNIGLSLKFSKRNEETPGYTKKSEDGHWFYSPKAIDLIRSYMLKCPDLFERLAQNPTACIFQEEHLFKKCSGELSDTVAWLKEQLKGIESQPCGMETIDSSIVKRIEEQVDVILKMPNSFGKVIEIQVQPYLLYAPSLLQRNLPPDGKAQTQLLDRICCTKENFTVPLGYKGTVIGIQRFEDASNNMYDVLFDKTFVGGLSINGSTELRAYRLSSIDFINISYGERIEHGRGTMDAHTEFVESWNSMPNQEAQLRANASAFASYKNRNHLPVDLNSLPRPRVIHKNPEGMSQNSQQTQKFRCNPQNIVNVREPYKSVKSIQVNAQRKPLAVQLTSEFQAIWNELHKKQEPNKVAQQAPMEPKVKQINKGFPENSPQDPSAFLKAVLKIPDGDTKKAELPATPETSERTKNVQKENKALDTPPLVQQLFDHARENEKVKDDKTLTWYCSQLLNYYQLSGVGMPRYSYIADGETNLIQAHILLPDKRIFVGNPCVGYEQAAGSAAKKVYTELKLANILPYMKTLIPPPQHWYSNSQNSNWTQNIRPPAVPYHAPEPKPLPLQQFPEWVHKGQHNSGQQHVPKQNEKYRHPVAPKSINNESKSETKNCPTFVPLQAQKKSRHNTAKQVANKDIASQSAKDNSRPKVQQKKNDSPGKMTKVEAATATNDKEEPVQSNSKQGQITPTAVKPKKSRVAAKFGISSQTGE